MKSHTYPLLIAAGLSAIFSFHSFLRAESVADQKKNYPTDVCLVSVEKLGSMGEPVEYIIKDKDGNDVLILLCCKGCKKELEKDSQPVLKKLQDLKNNAKKSATLYPSCVSCKG